MDLYYKLKWPGTALSSHVTVILKVPALLGRYVKTYVEEPASRHEVSTSLPSSKQNTQCLKINFIATKQNTQCIGS